MEKYDTDKSGELVAWAGNEWAGVECSCGSTPDGHQEDGDAASALAITPTQHSTQYTGLPIRRCSLHYTLPCTLYPPAYIFLRCCCYAVLYRHVMSCPLSCASSSVVAAPAPGDIDFDEFKQLVYDGMLLEGAIQDYEDAFNAVDSSGNGSIGTCVCWGYQRAACGAVCQKHQALCVGGGAVCACFL